MLSKLRAAIRWMFAPPIPPVSLWRVILWWELRRLPYNVAVATYGLICLLIFFWSVQASGRGGDDVFEPLGLLIAPIVVNVCYTFGWIVEVAARQLRSAISPGFGPRLLKFGLGFSAFVISIPAVFWGGYRLLQVVRVLR